jgi:1-deoxy-D-xylulose-5-phosphate reductoisomerase
VVLLGSTGSIGTAALDVARRFKLPVETLVAGHNSDLLNHQIAEFRPKRVVLASREAADRVTHPHKSYGPEAILAAIEESQSPLVLNALVGFAGLEPTLTAIACGKRVALANKESLVAAGAFVDTRAIHPVDSEHFGLWYLLGDRLVQTMTLTASGGALRDLAPEAIEEATLKAVLKHPNWSMGQKITIDSATMANKLFEVLEAYWLFHDRFTGRVEIEGVIERSSIIHALITFKDGSTTAQLAGADMRLPIAYALLERIEEPVVPPCDLTTLAPLKFDPIDCAHYPLWTLKSHLLKNPALGVVVNAANEAAIERFCEGQIPFGQVARSVLAAAERFTVAPESLGAIFELDREVRAWSCAR